MNFNSSKTSVPLSHSLGLGTAGQSGKARDKTRDVSGPVSLKALASKVLLRDAQRDISGTEESIAVPGTKTVWDTSLASSSVIQADGLSEEFNERASIYEFDGGLTRIEAERLAYFETVTGYMQTHHPGLIRELRSAIYQTTFH